LSNGTLALPAVPRESGVAWLTRRFSRAVSRPQRSSEPSVNFQALDRRGPRPGTGLRALGDGRRPIAESTLARSHL